MIVLFNKPYGVVSQFSLHKSRPTLSNFIKIPNIYPAGRLDANSEGLMVLTDNGNIQYLLSNPQEQKLKTYLVQVEGKINTSHIKSKIPKVRN